MISVLKGMLCACVYKNKPIIDQQDMLESFLYEGSELVCLILSMEKN